MVLLLLDRSFCVCVSPNRTCSASTPLEEVDMEKKRKQTIGLRPSEGAWMRHSPRGVASLNTEWHKRECEKKWEKEEELRQFCHCTAKNSRDTYWVKRISRLHAGCQNFIFTWAPFKKKKFLFFLAVSVFKRCSTEKMWRVTQTDCAYISREVG